MFASFFRPFYLLTVSLIVLCLLFCVFIPAVYPNYTFTSANYSSVYYLNLSDESFPWPTPGYTVVTSPFGYRNAPTSGASSYHSGIDIGAPTGTNIIAVCSGKVTFLGFNRCWWIYYYNRRK